MAVNIEKNMSQTGVRMRLTVGNSGVSIYALG